jgi:hypothetical protein
MPTGSRYNWAAEGCITLWLSLDSESHTVSRELHSRDLRFAGYSRGFYEEAFPEACILIDAGQSTSKLRASLSFWAKRIIDEWYATS